MRLLASLVLLGLSLVGCETTTNTAHNKQSFNARVTFYTPREDKYHNKVAMSSYMRAQEGRTIAADHNFQFGTRFYLERLAGIVGSGIFTKEDIGRDVERRRASHGLLPVIDVYVATKKKYNWLLKNIEPVLTVTPL